MEQIQTAKAKAQNIQATKSQVPGLLTVQAEAPKILAMKAQVECSNPSAKTKPNKPKLQKSKLNGPTETAKA